MRIKQRINQLILFATFPTPQREHTSHSYSHPAVPDEYKLLRPRVDGNQSRDVASPQWAGKQTLTILVTRQLDQDFYLVVQS